MCSSVRGTLLLSSAGPVQSGSSPPGLWYRSIIHIHPPRSTSSQTPTNFPTPLPTRHAAWESLAHHHNLINDTVAYPPLVTEISAIFDLSGLSAFHVAFATLEPWRAIEAPVLEIATFALLPGKDKDALEKVVDELARAIEEAPEEGTGAVSAAWGPTVEHEEWVVLFAGWASVEVRCVLECLS